jgi:hypothetical protein
MCEMPKSTITGEPTLRSMMFSGFRRGAPRPRVARKRVANVGGSEQMAWRRAPVCRRAYRAATFVFDREINGAHVAADGMTLTRPGTVRRLMSSRGSRFGRSALA